MSGMNRLLRTTLIGGFLFLIPFVFVVVILEKAFQIMNVVAAPIDRLIPIETVAGFATAQILAVLLLVAICLVAGLLARSAWARELNARVDAFLLNLIPGYAWIKGVTGEISDADAGSMLAPVLVNFDDQSQLGFEVDRRAEGLVAVYLPGSPDPRSGMVSYVTPDRIQVIDATFGDVVKVCKRLGRDSAGMLPDQAGFGAAR